MHAVMEESRPRPTPRDGSIRTRAADVTDSRGTGAAPGELGPATPADPARTPVSPRKWGGACLSKRGASRLNTVLIQHKMDPRGPQSARDQQAPSRELDGALGQLP